MQLAAEAFKATLLLHGGVSGWLLDELSARTALSSLDRALGVLSIAIEGATQAVPGKLARDEDAEATAEGGDEEALHLALAARPMAMDIVATSPTNSTANPSACPESYPRLGINDG